MGLRWLQDEAEQNRLRGNVERRQKRKQELEIQMQEERERKAREKEEELREGQEIIQQTRAFMLAEEEACRKRKMEERKKGQQMLQANEELKVCSVFFGDCVRKVCRMQKENISFGWLEIRGCEPYSAFGC